MDGTGIDYTKFAHGLLFAKVTNNIKAYENGNDRGVVGNGCTRGFPYRVRIRMLSGGGATYEIQGWHSWGGLCRFKLVPLDHHNAGNTTSADDTLTPASWLKGHQLRQHRADLLMSALTLRGQPVFGSSAPFLTADGRLAIAIASTTNGLALDGEFVFGLPSAGATRHGSERPAAHRQSASGAGLTRRPPKRCHMLFNPPPALCSRPARRRAFCGTSPSRRPVPKADHDGRPNAATCSSNPPPASAASRHGSLRVAAFDKARQDRKSSALRRRKSLPGVHQAGVGVMQPAGTAACALPHVRQAASGLETFTASAAQVLPSVDQSGVGVMQPAGTYLRCRAFDKTRQDRKSSARRQRRVLPSVDPVRRRRHAAGRHGLRVATCSPGRIRIGDFHRFGVANFFRRRSVQRRHHAAGRHGRLRVAACSPGRIGPGNRLGSGRVPARPRSSIGHRRALHRRRREQPACRLGADRAHGTRLVIGTAALVLKRLRQSASGIGGAEPVPTIGQIICSFRLPGFGA